MCRLKIISLAKSFIIILSQNIHVMERVNFRICADIFYDLQNEI